MPEVLSKAQQQFMELWSNLDKSQKNRIYITSAILIIAITVGIFLLTRPSYMTLIKNADTKEVGEMTKILDEKRIWNKVDNGGSNIVINTKDNSKAQAALVQNGYPKTAGMTFDDAFKMIKLNTTESDKKKLWEEYKAKSLSSKLKMLDNVEYADVTLTMPEPSPFVGSNEAEKPSASVVVKPKGELSAKQIKGIATMVASSVEGLDPGRVSIVDNNSNPLNAENEDVFAPGTQHEMRLKVKRELEKAVRDLFNGQFDNFDVIRVSANPVLDFNTEKTQKVEYANPEGIGGGALISSDELKEKMKDAGANGVPGTDTNPVDTNSPSYQFGPNQNSQYDKEHNIRNFEYNKTVKDQVKALGEMDLDKSSMSVALFYGNRVADDSRLTPEFITELKSAVSAATGIPAAKVSVSKYKLAAPIAENKPISEVIKELFNTYGLFALILLLMIGLIIVAIPKKQKELEPELAADAGLAGLTGPKFILPESNELLPEIELEERSEVKKQIDKFVRQKPEAVAQLLRNWLSDEWD